MINYINQAISRLNIHSYVTPTLDSCISSRKLNELSDFSRPYWEKCLANRRVKRVIVFIQPHLQKCLANDMISRITKAALPVLSLYQPFGIFIAGASGLIQAGTHTVELVKKIREGDLQGCLHESLQITLAIGSIAGAIFNHRIGLIFTASYEVAMDVYRLGICIWQGKPASEIAGAFFQTIRHSIHLVSVVCPSPQMIIISLVAQLIFEGYEAFNEFRQGHILEGVVKLILIGVHSTQLTQQVKALDNPAPIQNGQEISSENLSELLNDFRAYQEQHPNQKIKFETFLKKHHYSNHLVKADFSKAFKDMQSNELDQVEFFKGIDFRNVHFTECNFEAVNLNEAQFKGTLNNCNFQRAFLERTTFEKCLIRDSDFQFTSLTQSIFNNSVILRSVFNFSNLNQSQFIKTHLFESSFKQASLNQSKFLESTLEKCNLEKALFKETEFIKSTLIEVYASAANFAKTTMTNCQILQSNFSDCIFKRATILNSTFSQTNLNDISFNYGTLKEVKFEQTQLNYVSFHDTSLSKIRIQGGTLLGASFLDATVEQSSIRDADLTDCLFFETKNQFKLVRCTDNIITRPIIGLPWNVDVPGFTVPKVYRSLKTYQAIPLKLDYLPEDIDVVKLDLEVKAEIDLIKQEPNFDQILSIPDEILNRAKPNTEIFRIQQRAKHFAGKVSAIILPGGNNVEAEFYGGKKLDPIYYDPDYRRSLFEFSMLKEATSNQLPIVSICRGFQLTNVYFGGTIKDVEGQWGQIQDYTIQEGSIRQLIGEKITGVSTHRQAVDKIADNLKVVITYDGIIKAAEGINSQIYGFQFHPEWVLDNDVISKENANVFIHHVELAKNFKRKDVADLIATFGT